MMLQNLAIGQRILSFETHDDQQEYYLSRACLVGHLLVRTTTNPRVCLVPESLYS